MPASGSSMPRAERGGTAQGPVLDVVEAASAIRMAGAVRRSYFGKIGRAEVAMRTWILLADAASARLYVSGERPGDWTLLREIEHPESRMRPSELLSDRPGRVKQSTGSRDARSRAAASNRPGARQTRTAGRSRRQRGESRCAWPPPLFRSPKVRPPNGAC